MRMYRSSRSGGLSSEIAERICSISCLARSLSNANVKKKKKHYHHAVHRDKDIQHILDSRLNNLLHIVKRLCSLVAARLLCRSGFAGAIGLF